MIIGRNFAEGYYEDERLYSTGYDELDELLERAFCEGYEYAQYEFSDDEEDEEDEPKRSHRGAKIAAGVGGGLAAAGLGVYGADKLGRSMDGGKIYARRSEKASKLLRLAEDARARGDEKLANKLYKKYKSIETTRAIGEKLHTPVDYAKAKGAALKSAGKAAKAAMKR